MQIASSEQCNWNYSGNRKKGGCFHFEDGKVKILKIKEAVKENQKRELSSGWKNGIMYMNACLYK